MDSKLEDFIISSSLPKFQNVRQVTEIQSESACGENENFVGQVLRIKCMLEFTSGEKKSIKIIIKKQPLESQPFTEMYKHFRIFNAEIDMYEKVLYGMEKLLTESGEVSWKRWPEYYGHNENDIFLQDLSVEGYNPFPKAKALGLDEALLVFSALGEFHGLSLTLVQKGIYDPSGMPPNIFVRNVPAIRQIEKDACNNLADAIEAEWGPEWQIYPEKIRKLGENNGEVGMKLWDETRGTFDVINHGDCWINNMLFKYDNSSDNLEDMRFVDYQACHYNSYSWDMMQVLYSAVLPSLRDANLDLLLSTYLVNLSKTSRKTGYKGALPTIQDMKNELDRLAPLALIRTFVCYPIFLNPEAMMPEKNSSSDEEDELDYKRSFYRSKFVRDILEDTLTYFYEKNLF